MATPKTIGQCVSLLRLMKGRRWEDAVHDVYYGEVFIGWPDDLAMRVVADAQEHLEWRPSRGELNRIAARLASPLPHEGDCWREFWHHVTYSTDAPDWSHPLLGDITARLGGWEYFRCLKPHWSEVDQMSIWFPRFMTAYEKCAAVWRDAVIDQLRLPVAKRDQRYFPQAKTFRALPDSTRSWRDGSPNLDAQKRREIGLAQAGTIVTLQDEQEKG